MQFKIATLVAVIAALGASAKPSHHSRALESRDYQCEEGKPACCSLIAMDNNTLLGPILNAVGGVAEDLLALLGKTGLIGHGCTPINALGLTQNGGCANQPVCCTDKEYKGLIVAACSPIKIL
ncbi:hypothetical protein FA13DRAFT_1737413 [Coprinellus micaceus]|uniref:Hydrophobin n=1 Tax=Coprinellus micaceus TaxID=71717 RepID=A0A4Y7SXB5_COPMI|nr:hypothetical protein FA13DRAFT_1737413 [Coprinellus micaceus]